MALESLQSEISDVYICLDEAKTHLEKAMTPDTSEENRRRVEERVCLPYDGPKEVLPPRGEWDLPGAAIPALCEAVEYWELGPRMDNIELILKNH